MKPLLRKPHSYRYFVIFAKFEMTRNENRYMEAILNRKMFLVDFCLVCLFLFFASIWLLLMYRYMV